MRNKLLLFTIALFIIAPLLGQANKMKGSPSKYHFKTPIPEKSWRKVQFKELEKENAEGLEALMDTTLLYFAGYIKKGSKSIKDYPSLSFSIYSLPDGLKLSDIIQDQNDTISINSISSLTKFNVSTIFFDSKTSSTFLKTILPDSNLLYMQVYFSKKHMAFVKMYINVGEENKYASLFLDMVKTAGFEEKYRLKLK